MRPTRFPLSCSNPESTSTPAPVRTGAVASLTSPPVSVVRGSGSAAGGAAVVVVGAVVDAGAVVVGVAVVVVGGVVDVVAVAGVVVGVVGATVDSLAGSSGGRGSATRSWLAPATATSSVSAFPHALATTITTNTAMLSQRRWPVRNGGLPDSAIETRVGVVSSRGPIPAPVPIAKTAGISGPGSPRSGEPRRLCRAVR